MNAGMTGLSPSETRQAGTDPLIVTLCLDAASSQFFDRKRREHFPTERNFLAAHVTLFHHLPGGSEQEVRRILADAAANSRQFRVTVDGLRSLGRGVAYSLASADLTKLRADLAECFEPWLTPQDRQRFKPHVTVQNKVTPETARALLAALQAGFVAWDATAMGLELWAYRGGPWSARAFLPFAAAP